MDKKQLYIVMVVSVLMLVGILVYRWIVGEPGDKGASKPKPAATGAMQPGTPEARTTGAREAARPAEARGAQATLSAAAPAAKAEPLDVTGVTDGAVLVRRFRLAFDRGETKAAVPILRQAVTLAQGNPALLGVVDEALDAWWAHPAQVAPLAPEVELASKRLQVTPTQGAFDKAYAVAALATVRGDAAAALGQAWQRAALAAKTDLARGHAATWQCALTLRQTPPVTGAPACALAVQKGGDHRAYFFAATLALRTASSSAEAAALLTRALKLEPTFRPALDALATLHVSQKRAADAAAVLAKGAKALAGAGRHRAALALYGRAAGLQPGVAAHAVGLARAHVALGDTKAALAAYRKAAALAKGDIQVRLALARLLQDDDLLGAVRVLVDAEQIDPASQAVKQALSVARAKLAARQPKKVEERITMVDGKRLRMVFTTAGGVPRALVLKHKKFRERGNVKGPELRVIKDKELAKQVNLVRTWSEFWLPLRLAFVKPSFPAPRWEVTQDWQRLRWDPAQKAYRPLAKGEAHAVREGSSWRFGYRWPVEYEGMAPPPVVVERLYQVDPDQAYHWNMEIRVVNRSAAKQFAQLELRVPSYDQLEEDRSFFNPISLKKEAICMVGEKVQMQTLPTLFQGSSGCMGCDASTCACRRTPAKGSVSQGELVAYGNKDRSMSFTGRVHWAGIDEMYFLLGVASAEKDDSTCTLMGWKDPGNPKHGVLMSRLVLPGRELLTKDAVLSHRFTVYSGPKISEELDRVRVGNTNPKLAEAIDYGFFWFIGQPMIYLMKKIYVVVGNWGLAIILLTLLIKLLTLPLTVKQMRSMKGMAKLKPEMDKLKEKYGEDKQRFQQEMWSLYKAHKINPLGGCLPLVIQMPIYIAWYQALMVSVDLYNAPLFGWIHDLTKPDSVQLFGFGIPILPLLMGATMFLQQRMTPTTVDSAQQKMMMYMMPAMFTFFMLFLPSGLTLYILTNTLLTMAHQWYMNHAD